MLQIRKVYMNMRFEFGDISYKWFPFVSIFDKPTEINPNCSGKCYIKWIKLIIQLGLLLLCAVFLKNLYEYSSSQLPIL